MKSIKIALVDDESLFLEGLSLLISKLPNCTVVYKTNNPTTLIDDLVQTPPDQRPDILLLDIEMEPMSGLEVVEQLTPCFPSIKILILSSHYKSNLIGHMIKMGVSGFLPKIVELNKLRDALETVYATGIYFSSEDYHLLRSYLNDSKKNFSIHTDTSLTSREIEVVKLVCQEFTNQEIADRLFLSKRTVESHRQRVLDKLGLKNTVGLVIYALANKIFIPKPHWKS